MTDIKGKFTDSNYTWAEDRPGGGGGGPRSMKIMGSGVSLKWLVSPNPHDNPTYNGGKQEDLYKGFVKEINKGWPTKDKVSYKPIKDVSDVKDKALKKKMMAMDKKKQTQALKLHNAECEQAAEDAAAAKYLKAVASHFAKKKGSKFKLGAVNHKLG